MKDTLINRREFLKNIGMLGAGVLLSASPWLSAFSEVKETSNEKCRLAVIGPGSRGRFLMSFLVQNPKVDIVALCDIHDTNASLSDVPAQGKGLPASNLHSGSRKYG
mgnify:CR=1 FL=1